MWLQTMLGIVILIETPPTQLSSRIPGCDHWCQDLCCGLCSCHGTRMCSLAHSWVISPQSMNYASSRLMICVPISTQHYHSPAGLIHHFVGSGCSHASHKQLGQSQSLTWKCSLWSFQILTPKSWDSVPRPEGTALCHLPAASYPSSWCFQSLPPTMTPQALKYDNECKDPWPAVAVARVNCTNRVRGELVPYDCLTMFSSGYHADKIL